jgi:hypothetical protein
MSWKNLLAGLLNVKKTPTLSKWTKLLDIEMTKGEALAKSMSVGVTFQQ